MLQTAPTSGPSASSLLKTALWPLGAAVGYYVLGYVGTVLSVPPSDFAIIWPTTAFLTGVLLLTPVRDWWTYGPGLVLAHLLLWSNTQPAAPLVVALTQVGGNLLLAVATALAVRRLGGGRAQFDTFRGALAFILVAGLAAPAVINAMVLGVHVLTGWAHGFWLSWRQFMFAGIFPTVTITPLMLIAGGKPPGSRRRIAWVERLLVCAALFALALTVFGGVEDPTLRPTLLLAPLPLILWAAARWGVDGASLALLVFGSAIVANALQDKGPFAANSTAVDVLSVQVYLTAVSIPTILMAALMQERRNAEERLRRSEARMEIAAAATDTGLWQWDAETRELWMTEHCRTMFALPADPPCTFENFLDAIHPQDRPRVRVALYDAIGGEERDVRAFRTVTENREERWFTMRTHAEPNRNGGPACVSGAFRDITQQLASEHESARLTRRLQTLQDDERRQIAEALHDGTAQHVVGIGLLMGMIERRTELTDEARALVENVRGLVREATKELRVFTYLLRPADVERQKLSTVLKNYVAGFGLRTGIQVTADVGEAAETLPVEHRRALLRITQESLANVHRHAAATHVVVQLRRAGVELHLLIKDNGRGIAAASDGAVEGTIATGVGIPGMRARIRELGGWLDIRSTAEGTVVDAVLPVAAVAARSNLLEARRADAPMAWGRKSRSPARVGAHSQRRSGPH